jgi:L-lactate dehydrogenase complex protein LldG
VSAREKILGRIRTNSGRSGPTTEAELAAVRAVIAQHATGPALSPGWSDDLARFKERAVAMASTVATVASRADVPAAVAAYLRDGGLPTRGVCWSALGDLPWPSAGLEVEPRPAQDGDLVGITGAFCAIAETGTLVLLSGKDTPARSSLLPETHVAVVDAGSVVPSMEAAWQRVRDRMGRLPRAVNFVSGPSRTADIEQTLVLGAHGPYRVHIVVVG